MAVKKKTNPQQNAVDSSAAGEQSTLRQAIGKLDKIVTDLSSLHVQTYAGTAEFVRSDNGTFDNIRDTLSNKGSDQNQQIKLKAETLIQFDGDSYNFIADGTSDQLLKMHKDAVEAGIKTRQGLMELVKDVFD